MIEMLQKKLRDYGAANAVEEDNATKEIIQEIALYALWRADFFDVALFQGGTSLRILHGLPRFSEDLDFLLRNMGVRAVVLNGGFTDCCVLNAAFDASNLDYRVVVAQDLVRGTNEEMEDAALKMMSLHMALVMDSEDILKAWDARGAKASQAAE